MANRPGISIRLDAATLHRLDALVSLLPGSTRTAVLEEVLLAGLPLYEEMAQAIIAARDERGVVDDQRARDAMAMWAGQQLLGLHHTDDEGGDED